MDFRIVVINKNLDKNDDIADYLEEINRQVLSEEDIVGVVKHLGEEYERVPKAEVDPNNPDAILININGFLKIRCDAQLEPIASRMNDMIGGKMNESMYARGFKKDFNTGANIFGLIKDIKAYTCGMPRDEAIEEAVYATADYVKDGNL